MGPRRLVTGVRRRGQHRWQRHWHRVAGATGGPGSAPAGGVALTYDDGPMPGSTDRLLDLLAAHGARATFFLVGRNAQAHPALARRIAAEGHAVGSHSLTHPTPAELTPWRLHREYADGRAAVEDVLGREVPLFRPPHGTVGLRGAVVLRRLGLVPVLWGPDAKDYHVGVRREQVEDVAGGAESGDVVLMHDWVEQPYAPSVLDRSATVEALPAVVARLRARDLEPVPLG